MDDKTLPGNYTAGTRGPPASSVVGISQFLRDKLEQTRITDYLTSHGFCIDDAERMGWTAATPDTVRYKLGLHNSDTDDADIALLMPCFNINGTRDQQYNRAIIFKNDGTYLKRTPSAKKVANRVMYVPGMDYLKAPQIILCESLPKAAFVSLRFGVPAIGLNGIDGWSAADFASLPKDAEIIFLSDSLKDKSAQNIQGSARRLSALFPKFRFASPQLPPADWPKDDWGIDDAVLHAGEHGAYVFKSTLDSARPISKPDTADPILYTSDTAILARPSPQWIVKNLIPPGELTGIVGKSSCGKTFLTMDLLLAVARGDETWFGQRIKKQGLVVHITLEGTRLGDRRRAYQQYHKLNEPLPYVAIETPVNLRDDATADALIASINEAQASHGLPVVLIAVDTVNRALGGGDENSSVDMGAFLGNSERIKAAFPGCGVLLVHHLGKDEHKGARGHSSFTANIGAELLIDEDEATKIRTLSITKQRDGNTDMQFNFKLEPVDLGQDEDGEAIGSCVVLRTSVQVERGASHESIYGQIFMWWQTHHKMEPVSKDVIKERFRIITDGKAKRDQVVDAFLWAVDQGMAVCAGDAKNGKRYTLKPLDPKKY
jgi:AAA domain